MKYSLFFLLVSLMFTGSRVMAQSLPGGFNGVLVEGNVMASDTGKPIAGAKIDVVGTHVKHGLIKHSNDCGSGFAMSAANGNFAVGVGSNNMCVSDKHPSNAGYYISIAKRGYLPQHQLISANGPQSNFLLQKLPSSINGQVFGPNGKGLAYAHVMVVKDVWSVMLNAAKGLSLHAPHHPLVMSEVPLVRADSNGMFSIPVSPGDYMLEAVKAGYKSTTMNVDPLAAQYAQIVLARPLAAQMRRAYEKLESPQPGDFVQLPNGGIGIANFTMVKGVAYHPPAKVGRIVTTRPYKRPFTPYRMLLVGDAGLSPNNVLFFMAQNLRDPITYPMPLFTVVRSAVQLGAGKVDPFKSHIKTFNFGVYGYPGKVGCRLSTTGCRGDLVYSFTDSTAKPGTRYYYYIFEMSPSTIDFNFKLGQPQSNAVPLTTH